MILIESCPANTGRSKLAKCPIVTGFNANRKPFFALPRKLFVVDILSQGQLPKPYLQERRNSLLLRLLTVFVVPVFPIHYEARLSAAGLERLSLSHSVYLHQLHFSEFLVLAINRFC